MNQVTLTHDDPSMIKRAEESFSKGKFLEEFIPNTGDPDAWYMFAVENWGTKWDVGSADGIVEVSDNSISLSFDSAWSPPIEGYSKLEELGFTVDAMYYEPGIGFAGMYADGADEYFELSGMSSEEIKDELPEELNDAFGISEDMAQWEEEDDS